MNILVVNWRCIKNPEKGGAEVHLHEIFKRIVALGHNVTLVAHKFSGSSNEEIIDGIKIIRIGSKFLFNRQFKKFYLNNLQQSNFDLIVDDISKIPLNIPKYVNLPTVGILHHIHGESLYKEIPFPLAYYIYSKEKQIPKNYSNSFIFTVSNSTSEELNELGFPEERIDILHNAIDHELFSRVDVKKSPTPLFTYVGRIKKYKNIDLIIDAFNFVKNKLPKAKLIIGGKGDCLTKLKQIVEEKNLTNHVEFRGYLSEKEKAELLGKAWLFLTMAEKEGWGITVIEANAMKTPSIGANVQGLRDSIQNNKTGYLVPPGNVKALSEKIIEVCSNKSDLDTLSNNAYNWSKNFTWDNSAKHFLKKISEWYPELKSKI